MTATGAMQFFMIVDDPQIAAHVATRGVARLFVDLEYMGKDQRQKGLDTWKSRQMPQHVSKIREAAPDAHVLVRINPLHDQTATEIDDVIGRGADSIMLPMFQGYDDLARFLDLLAGRVEAVPLIETVGALRDVPRLAEALSLSRVHIGLNDLHLELGLDFMFQPIADGLLEEPCAALRQAGVAFGIGGVARTHEGIVSPNYLLGEHVRLGSDAAILSRTFHRGAASLDDLTQEMDFATETQALQAIYAEFGQASDAALQANKTLTADKIMDVVTLIRKKQAD